MAEFNSMQTIKRRFFAMRNGILADTLRKGGSPYEMIFGLNLPQLTEIARDIGPDETIAHALLDDRRTRESQMLSSLIMPPESLTTVDVAKSYIDALRSTEAVDVACLKLLKKTDFVLRLAESCLGSTDSMQKYAGLRLLWNIYFTYPKECRSIASSFSDDDPRLLNMAKTLIEEIDFMDS